MSLRGTKRAAVGRGEDSGACKRRKADPETDAQWQPRSINDLKISTIYNRSAPEAPAELFRKDLISAMKLPDSEPLSSNEYWVINDPWKQEWERGVQVPVNPDSLPEPAVTEIPHSSSLSRNEFKLPKQKYVRLSRDGHFNSSEHYLSSVAARAEAACAYDMDACDAAWLRAYNGERARAGIQPIKEEQLEKVIEQLEICCWEKIQAIMRSEEGLGIEYDENVICDVCRSPDSEEGNEMVFCDACNICVHQACYGITAIPSGQWLCRPCGDKVKPVCVLCPNLGGAMKCTPSGHKWAHVSCVLWIPEVSIGCAEKMEPITKISAIPASRWSLVCVLCRERTGACIQCSVKTCKTAYHVTCAFKHGLEMRAIIEDEHADDGVKLRSYCQKHSVNSKKDKCAGSGSEEEDIKRKRRKDMTSEEKSQARAIRLQEVESEFDRHVTIKDISTHRLDIDQDAIQYMYNYWKLKRRASFNRPLLPPKSDESDMLNHRQEQADLDKMKMFVQLRQDLERVRNLCYMVSRREKLSRSFFRMREQTFHKQVAVLSGDCALPPATMAAVIEANHGPSIYDRLYSHPGAVDHSADFETLVAQIAGTDSGDDKKKEKNGLVKNAKPSNNPYKRMYVNGSARRSASLYSGLSSGPESLSDRDTKYRKHIYTTTDDDEKPPVQTSKKKLFSKEKDPSDNSKLYEKKKSRQPVASRSKLDSSSEDDVRDNAKHDWPRSRTLQQMEKEMGPLSGTDSDELMPMKSVRKSKISPIDIYSDSESDINKPEDNNEDKSSNATSDSQQQMFRTKAAVKEFIPLQRGSTKMTRRRKTTSKEQLFDSDYEKDTFRPSTSKIKEYSSDLIVPQRQAAKKASENMRSTTTVSVKSKDSDTASIDSRPSISIDQYRSKVKQNIKEKRKNKDSSKEFRKESKPSTSNDVFEFEKEDKDSQDILAYVPQRQAAKKAAEHIKSGMAKIPGAEVPIEENKKKETVDAIKKQSPKKDEEKLMNSPNKSSSSSSFNSSSTSSSSSSSSSEGEDEVVKPPLKRITDKRSMVKSLFSPPRRMNEDLPFLDKGSKVVSSSSPSSDSETNKSPSKLPIHNSPPRRFRSKKSDSPSKFETNTKTDGTPHKAPDKKLKTSDGQLYSRASFSSVEREKSPRTTGPKPSTRTRSRTTTSGPRNMSDRKNSRTRKSSNKDEKAFSFSQHKDSKESSESSKFSSEKWKTDKKIKPPKYASEKPNKSKESIESKTSLDNYKKSNLSGFKEISDDKLKNTSPVRLSHSHSYDKDINKSDDYRSRRNNSAQKKSSEISTHKSSIQSDNKYDSIDIENFKKIDLYSNNKSSFSTSIKSPKTPIDVDNKLSEPYEGQTLKLKKDKDINTSKRETDEKVSSFDMVAPDFSETSELEHKISKNTYETRPVYHNRSIFSPQPTSKDGGCSEFFSDFGNDILAVDETVNDDGFNISQNNEEIMKTTPLSFFADNFLFKEDSKEDRGVRETLNLVEKLRLTLSSKKPGVCNQNEGSDLDSECKDSQKSMPMFTDCDNNRKEMDFERSSYIDKDMRSPIIQKPEELKDKIHDNQKESDNYANKLDELTVPKESEKKWPNLDHQIEDTGRGYIELNKEVLQNPCMLQNVLLSKMDSRNDGMVSREPFMQTSDMDKNFKPQISTSRDCMELMQTKSHEMSREEVNISRQESQQQMPNYETDTSNMQAPECTPIPSPYNSMRQQSKWSERELIPARRSSTSSSASDSSIDSHKRDDILPEKTTDDMQVQQSHSRMMTNIGYPPYHPCAMDAHSYPFTSEASQFVTGPVSLFPPTTIGSQLPLSSPGVGMFPPSLSLPYSSANSNISQLAKAEETIPFSTPCAAAFTSSSHNMALMAAMVAPPTPKPISDNSPIHDAEANMTPPNSLHIRHESVPMPTREDTTNNNSLSQTQTVMDNNHMLNTQVSPLQDKKSPTKPTRMSSRFISQQTKSPGKSPGKSPKQLEVVNKATTSRRGAPRGARGSRGRGRPRGRGNHHMHSYPNIDLANYFNPSYNKLAGTVYDLDFDEDIASDSMGDLKSMRERRRSTDVHERKPENMYRDSSESPKFTSPPQAPPKRPSYNTDLRDLRPPTPAAEIPSTIETPSKSPAPISNRVEAVSTPFTNIVQPVLPGPVDMRTYSAFEQSSDAFNNHLLGAFASGTADQQLADIDEEMEKELHSALLASSNKSQEPLPPQPSEPPEIVPEEPVSIPQCIPIPKVSLSDSRNQLKVKIKGPFLDANYSTSSLAPVIQQPSLPIMDQPSGVTIMGTPSAVGSVSSAMMSGTSNLRRMRKKELLRQYCTQDMNMDDPIPGGIINQVIPPPPITPFSRTVITIPKAVASMTSIPTREDYKAVVDANNEKKRRKISAGLMRDIRPMDNDTDMQDNISLSGLSTPSQLAMSYKRRGRLTKPVQSISDINPTPLAPKLKIKIGPYMGSSEPGIGMNDPNYVVQFKPPKKRHTSIPKPSVEDLRRDSMKFRRKVMADFEETKESKKEKKKRLKTEKRKKKKDKRAAEMHVVNKQDSDESNTKLIIRIARKKDDPGTNNSEEENTGAPAELPAPQPPSDCPNPSADPFDYDPTAPDPLALDSPASAVSPGGSTLGKGRTSKVSPIRLKFARTGGGASYVMKDPPGPSTAATEAIPPPLVEPSTSNDPLACPTLSHNKHCEVR